MNKSAFLGLRTVIYTVDDIDEAKAWYTKILDAPPYFDEPFYVGFNVGGYELGLQPVDENENYSTPNEVAYWGVDDVKMQYQRLLELGATALESPENVGGDIVVATVKDPWGNAIGIIYNPSFKTEK